MRVRGKRLAPFVPSPFAVVKEMLDIADIKRREKVYDLGCGDGRILALSVRPPYNARALGVELNKCMARGIEECLGEYDLGHRIEVNSGDMLDYDVVEADVVMLYLTSRGNKAVKPMLEDQLSNRARVVSHDFKIEGWDSSAVRGVIAPFGGIGPPIPHKIYLYEMDKVRKKR